jgi:hypothetical protein
MLLLSRSHSRAEKGKQMARSTSTRSRTTRTTRKTPARRTTTARTTKPVRAADKRTLKYYNFQYNRDDVSHARGANSVTITDRSNIGNSVSLSLQEARALYDFIGSQIRSR